SVGAGSPLGRAARTMRRLVARWVMVVPPCNGMAVMEWLSPFTAGTPTRVGWRGHSLLDEWDTHLSLGDCPIPATCFRPLWRGTRGCPHSRGFHPPPD